MSVNELSVPLEWVPTAEVQRILDTAPDPVDRAAVLAALSRINTLYMIMRAGSGHLGSSFSAADVVSWLLLEELRDPLDADGDVYFSSKGHDAPGLYATLIAMGGLDERLLHRLRSIDGLPGHPDVGTPHMPFNTGSLGMGISKAKGLVLANRMTGRRQRVVVLTGDGELQEGQNYEALSGAVHARMSELTVIVDHNKIQSDTWVRDVNDLGDVVGRFRGFGWGVLRCDGNDIGAVRDVLGERRERFPHLPVVIIADTVKGAGCATFAATSMAADEPRYHFHSGAPDQYDYRRAHAELVSAAQVLLDRTGAGELALVVGEPAAPRTVAGPSLPAVYGAELARIAPEDESIVALDADLVLDTGLIPFAERHPGRFVECGIAEQDMVSMAGAMAARGLTPFVHSFSCFLHARPNEQIYNNATEHRKVVYVGSLAGLLPAAPGHSHQAVRDVSAVGAVPGLLVLQPAGPAATEAAVRFCAATPHSVYLRLESVPVPERIRALPQADLALGTGHLVRAGDRRVVAVGAGPVVLDLLLAAADLLAPDIDLTVIDLPWLNRVDPDWLGDVIAGTEALVVVENQYTHGGQADLLARALMELDARPPVFRGIGLTGIPRCGTPEQVLEAHGLAPGQLAATVRAVVSQPAAVGETPSPQPIGASS